MVRRIKGEEYGVNAKNIFFCGDGDVSCGVEAMLVVVVMVGVATAVVVAAAVFVAATVVVVLAAAVEYPGPDLSLFCAPKL